MTPIDILIRSQLDSKGFQEATNYLEKMGDAVKAGFGIAIGERILGTLEKIPETLIDAAKEGIKFNATIEAQTVAFEILLGSVTAAHERIVELVEFSEKNPIFNFAEVSEADRLLQVLTKGALATADGLRLIGDVSAATGRPLQAAADMVGRFYGALDEGLPIQRSTLELFHMGLISADTARHLEEIGKTGAGIGNAMEITQQTFAKTSGAMGKQTETFNGQIKELKKNIEELGRSMTEGEVDPLKSLITGLNKGIKDLQLIQEGFQQGLSEYNLPASITKQAEAMETSIRKFIKARLEAGEIDADQASAEAKHLRVIQLTADATERLTMATQMMRNLRGGAPKIAGNKEGSATALVGPMPLTQEQNQMLDDLESKATEAHRAGLGERKALDEDYAAEKKRIDQLLGHNFEAWQEAMLDADVIFGRKRADFEAKQEQEGYEKYLDDEDRKKQANAKFLHEQTQIEMDALRIRRDQISLTQAHLEAQFDRTDTEKRGDRVKLILSEIDAIDKLIQKLTEEREAEGDPAAKQSLNQQITSLADQKRAAQAKLVPFTEGANPNSFGDQFLAKWTDMENQVGTMAQQSAKSFESAWNNALNVTSNGLTNFVMGNATAGEAIRSIYVGVVQGIIQEFSKMIVQWVATHVFMAGISAAFHATEVGQHAAAEATKTGITAEGSTARGVIRLGETIFHGVQVALRTAWHVAGEIAMTAMTVAQAAIRAAAALVEALPYLIIAAFKGAEAVADIPFIGPVLAIAAIGAIIAAGMGVLGGGGGKKGFAAGGYTGDGPDGSEAGVVHAGEYVFSAPQTKAIGVPNLRAMAKMAGGGWSGWSMASQIGQAFPGAGGGGGGRIDNSVHIAPVLHPDMVGQWMQSESGKKFIVDIARGVVLEMQN